MLYTPALVALAVTLGLPAAHCMDARFRYGGGHPVSTFYTPIPVATRTGDALDPLLGVVKVVVHEATVSGNEVRTFFANSAVSASTDTAASVSPTMYFYAFPSCASYLTLGSTLPSKVRTVTQTSVATVVGTTTSAITETWVYTSTPSGASTPTTQTDITTVFQTENIYSYSSLPSPTTITTTWVGSTSLPVRSTGSVASVSFAWAGTKLAPGETPTSCPTGNNFRAPKPSSSFTTTINAQTTAVEDTWGSVFMPYENLGVLDGQSYDGPGVKCFLKWTDDADDNSNSDDGTCGASGLLREQNIRPSMAVQGPDAHTRADGTVGGCFSFNNGYYINDKMILSCFPLGDLPESA